MLYVLGEAWWALDAAGPLEKADAFTPRLSGSAALLARSLCGPGRAVRPALPAGRRSLRPPPRRRLGKRRGGHLSPLLYPRRLHPAGLCRGRRTSPLPQPLRRAALRPGAAAAPSLCAAGRAGLFLCLSGGQPHAAHPSGGPCRRPGRRSPRLLRPLPPPGPLARRRGHGRDGPPLSAPGGCSRSGRAGAAAPFPHRCAPRRPVAPAAGAYPAGGAGGGRGRPRLYPGAPCLPARALPRCRDACRPGCSASFPL